MIVDDSPRFTRAVHASVFLAAIHSYAMTPSGHGVGPAALFNIAYQCLFMTLIDATDLLFYSK